MKRDDQRGHRPDGGLAGGGLHREQRHDDIVIVVVIIGDDDDPGPPGSPSAPIPLASLRISAVRSALLLTVALPLRPFLARLSSATARRARLAGRCA